MKFLAGFTTTIVVVASLCSAARAQTPQPSAPSPAGPTAGARPGTAATPVDPAPNTTISKQSLSAKGAAAMIDAIMAEAVAKSEAVSVAIVDEGGNLLAFKRMDHTSLGTIQAAMSKAVSALKLEMSSGTFAQNTNVALNFMSAGFTVLNGGEPIRAGNSVVGAIGVSGVRDDMAYVRVGLNAFKP